MASSLWTSRHTQAFRIWHRGGGGGETCKASGLAAVALRNAGLSAACGDWAEMAGAEGWCFDSFRQCRGFCFCSRLWRLQKAAVHRALLASAFRSSVQIRSCLILHTPRIVAEHGRWQPRRQESAAVRLFYHDCSTEAMEPRCSLRAAIPKTGRATTPRHRRDPSLRLAQGSGLAFHLRTARRRVDGGALRPDRVCQRNARVLCRSMLSDTNDSLRRRNSRLLPTSFRATKPMAGVDAVLIPGRSRTENACLAHRNACPCRMTPVLRLWPRPLRSGVSELIYNSDGVFFCAVHSGRARRAEPGIQRFYATADSGSRASHASRNYGE